MYLSGGTGEAEHWIKHPGRAWARDRCGEMSSPKNWVESGSWREGLVRGVTTHGDRSLSRSLPCSGSLPYSRKEQKGLGLG